MTSRMTSLALLLLLLAPPITCKLTPCPATCTCSHLSPADTFATDCSFQQLAAPPSVPTNSSLISFAGNSLLTVLPRDLLYPSTESLDLSHNFIHHLNSSAFAALSSIRTISLDFNRLHTIDVPALLAIRSRHPVTVSLVGNPMQCSCPLVALHNTVLNLHPGGGLSLRATCQRSSLHTSQQVPLAQFAQDHCQPGINRDKYFAPPTSESFAQSTTATIPHPNEKFVVYSNGSSDRSVYSAYSLDFWKWVVFAALVLLLVSGVLVCYLCVYRCCKKGGGKDNLEPRYTPAYLPNHEARGGGLMDTPFKDDDIHVLSRSRDRLGSASNYTSPSIYSQARSTDDLIFARDAERSSNGFLAQSSIYKSVPLFVDTEVLNTSCGSSDPRYPGTDQRYPEQYPGTSDIYFQDPTDPAFRKYVNLEALGADLHQTLV